MLQSKLPFGGVHFKAVGSMVLLLPRLVSLAFQSSMRSYLKACDTPPRTPTGHAPYSESDLEPASSPAVVSQEEDERLAKELSLKEAAAHDLSHRPKRRRFHESYNFNMKCPTPGCNSLGHLTGRHERHFSISGCPLYHNLSSDECKYLSICRACSVLTMSTGLTAVSWLISAQHS
ncbi:hypothetical protein CRUP_008353 [Coryphaenoides rupestris]|nr:hypothetical protein CRUP_008353 [Coryphaenoides rupestris]